jgi:hypothetical protein
MSSKSDFDTPDPIGLLLNLAQLARKQMRKDSGSTVPSLRDTAATWPLS